MLVIGRKQSQWLGRWKRRRIWWVTECAVVALACNGGGGGWTLSLLWGFFHLNEFLQILIGGVYKELKKRNLSFVWSDLDKKQESYGDLKFWEEVALSRRVREKRAAQGERKCSIYRQGWLQLMVIDYRHNL